MRVLFLVSSHEHAHDYGVDFVLDGFREILGPEQVVEWPEKPCLHLAPGTPRDACGIDSDQWWPSRGEIDIASVAQRAELVVLAHSLDDGDANQRVATVLAAYVPPSTPVLALDMHDSVENRKARYEQVAGRPVLYAKRELPIGADWGIPCPMTYPASRVPNPLPAKLPRVVYHATHHGEQSPGVPRKRIVDDLRRHPRIMKTALDVALYPSQQDRPSPEEYHDKMARGLVGIHWNGAPNWDANRWSESLAHGLCLVAERPRIQMPHPYEHLRHAYFVEHPERVAEAVAMLLGSPSWALAIADAGHQHFLKYHCSAARAAWLLEQVRIAA